DDEAPRTRAHGWLRKSDTFLQHACPEDSLVRQGTSACNRSSRCGRDRRRCEKACVCNGNSPQQMKRALMWRDDPRSWLRLQTPFRGTRPTNAPAWVAALRVIAGCAGFRTSTSTTPPRVGFLTSLM